MLPLSLHTIEEQSSICAQFSSKIQDLLNRIEQAGRTAGVLGVAQEELPVESRAVSAQALEELKKETSFLRQEVDGCLEQAKKMLGSAKVKYKALKSKDIIARLNKNVLDLEQHKAQLEEKVAAQIPPSKKGKIEQKQADVTMEEVSQKEALGLPPEVEQGSLKRKRSTEERQQEETPPAQRRKTEQMQKGDDVVGEGELYKILKKVESLKSNYSPEAMSLYLQLRDRDLPEGHPLRQFRSQYLTPQDINSEIQYLNLRMEEFKKRELELTKESGKELLSQMNNLIERLTPCSKKILTEENKELLEEFEQRLMSLEAYRLEIMDKVESLPEKEPTIVFESGDLKFPEVPPHPEPKLSPKEQLIKENMEAGFARSEAERLAEQEFLMERGKIQTQSTQQRQVPVTPGESQPSSPAVQSWQNLASNALKVKVMQELSTLGVRASLVYVHAGINAETIAGTVIGGTREIVGGYLPPTALAYRAYYKWNWDQRAAAAAVGIPTGVVVGLVTWSPSIGIKVGSTFGLVAGEAAGKIPAIHVFGTKVKIGAQRLLHLT